MSSDDGDLGDLAADFLAADAGCPPDFAARCSSCVAYAAAVRAPRPAVNKLKVSFVSVVKKG